MSLPQNWVDDQLYPPEEREFNDEMDEALELLYCSGLTNRETQVRFLVDEGFEDSIAELAVDEFRNIFMEKGYERKDDKS